LLAYAGLRDLRDPTITTEAVALTTALAKPDVLDVLARVAYHAALGRSPALPADACTRAKATQRAATAPDAVAYVCGHVALASRDGKTALDQLGAIRARTAWLDLELATARAAQLVGDQALAKKHAASAAKVTAAEADRAHVSSSDAKLVAARAKELLK
jgi:hypothetical protein